jgi:glutathione S-transferase
VPVKTGFAMKLLQSQFAPNPRRVRIFLAEKDINIICEEIDVLKQEHKRSDFARKNPMKQVPVLIFDDGTTLSESVAICRYFERLHPEPCMFGSSPLEEARIEMWNRRIEINLFYPVAQVFRHLHPVMKDLEVPQLPQWAEAYRPRVYEMLNLLDRELADRFHIAGDAFTVADITALVAIDFMKPARIALPVDLPNLTRWYDSVSSRPSAKA